MIRVGNSMKNVYSFRTRYSKGYVLELSVKSGPLRLVPTNWHVITIKQFNSKQSLHSRVPVRSSAPKARQLATGVQDSGEVEHFLL